MMRDRQNEERQRKLEELKQHVRPFSKRVHSLLVASCFFFFFQKCFSSSPNFWRVTQQLDCQRINGIVAS